MARAAVKVSKRKRQGAKSPAADTTPQLLLRAALAEFTQRGFARTDTNRIARRAGFAPQTFYRWYTDKTDIFVQLYQPWVAQELKAVPALPPPPAPAPTL